MQQGLLPSGSVAARPSTTCLLAVAVAVLAQLGLMVALLQVERSAASAAEAASGGGGTASSSRHYCTIMATDDYNGPSPTAPAVIKYWQPKLADQVDKALAAGCTLVGGLAVQYPGENNPVSSGGSLENNPIVLQAMMCSKATAGACGPF